MGDIEIQTLVKLQNDYELRRLEPGDYERGVLTVLKELTVVGDISKEQFTDFVNKLNQSPKTHYTLVIVNKKLDRVAAVGSILIEYKL
jgi:glucosamine-phosphate N-acetyltransferase